MNTQQLKARELRNNMTKQEKKIWTILKNRSFYGFRFQRQYSIGYYIVDFICRSQKIIIEIDGGQHNQPEDIEYDKNRTAYLESKGYRVLRFWNNEVDNNISGVYRVLQKEFRVLAE